MSTSTYAAGTLVRETGNFFDVDGDAADPSAITLQYQPGDGADVVVVTYTGGEIIRVSEGVYYFDIDTSGWTGPGTGTFTAQWTSTGNVQAAGVDYFQVAAPPIALP
jgi:hypothetical protein